MAESLPITAAEVTKHFVLAKCDYFVDVQLWPLRNRINPELWLENFAPTEMDHAVHLLNAFMYFPEGFIDELFKGAFHELSKLYRNDGDSYLSVQTAWRQFFDSAIITNVSGETPSITDSGITFARKAKKILGINENRILTNEETLEELVSRGSRPVVFVDDFVGSGEQFIKTWQRTFTISGSIDVSFEKLSTLRGNIFFYIPLLCTQYGLERIEDKCPRAIVRAAHIISNRYSAFAPDSLIWPAHLQASAADFIKAASIRAGIPTVSPDDWQGFHSLGLTVAFSDSVPDATLPLFTWEENGWKPLIRTP